MSSSSSSYRSLSPDAVPRKWRSFALVGGVIAVAAVAAAIALGIDDMHQRDKNSSSSGTGLSYAEQIRRNTSDIMRANMNFSINPCEDFYEYSCGGWLSRTTIPGDKKQEYFVMGEIDRANQHILKNVLTSYFDWAPITPYYELCLNRTAINAQGVAPLKPYLDAIEKLDDTQPTYQQDLIKLIATLHLVNANAFFSYSSGADLFKPKLSIGQLGQGGTQLGRSKYFPNMSVPAEVQVLANYTSHINTMLSFVGDASPKGAAAAIVQLEIQLANISMTSEQQRDINGTYHLYTLSSLEAASPIQWRDYLLVLGVPAADLVDTYPINVPSIEFLQGLDKLLVSTSVSTVRSYLRWTLIHAMSSYLTESIETETFNFFGKQISGIKTQKSRDQECISRVDGNLGQILGKYYIKEAFTLSGKQLVTTMMKTVIDAMHAKLLTVPFMRIDPATRDKAIEKLNKFREQIGFPDVWKTYNGLTLDHTSYFDDSVSIIQFLNQEVVRNVNHPVDANAWGMTTPTVNAYYDPPTNQIVIPAGILQGLYFNEMFHPAINYGGTGGTQGHEMTHGFDDQGSQYDGDGRFVNWWAPAVLEQWNKATACLSDFYSQYLVLDEPNFKLHLNGNLTNGENIADVGGLKQAFSAYQSFVNTTTSVGGISTSEPYFDWLSNERLFFVSYAQGWCEKSTREATIDFQENNPHSPGRFRVNGPVTQNREFARVFGCKVGQDTMAPNDICQVW